MIVGAGDFTGIADAPGADDLVIAADAGYEFAEPGSVDVVIGAFDSLKRRT